MTDPETRFLQNQQARKAAVRKHTKTNDANSFWAYLRGELALWNTRVERHNHEYLIAAERQLALQELATLQQDLKAMQKAALIKLELPVSDLRLLHSEFAACAQRLQNARDVACPPTRFVFSRYRAAWKEQNAAMGEELIMKEEKKIYPLKTGVTKGRCIQDLNDAVVVELLDIGVSVNFGDGKVDSLNLDSTGSTSLVLQNLHRCHVSTDVRYQLLHLINLVDCTVTCSARIDGAIHISSCTASTITASCRQLRIHETKNLRCKVAVGSGPIIEDSSNITFYAPPGDTVIRETKDFNWFRSEPSPNFEIIEQELVCIDESRQECHVPVDPQSSCALLESGCDDVDDEHDDDEL